MELYKKHRPKNLKQIVGNTELVSNLQNMIDQEEIPHAILLAGPYGCGKTTMGRIIAKEIGSFGMDYKELDTGVYRGIDTVRDLRKGMDMLPIQSKARVWLIDECFPGNTKIKTPNGEKQIKDIQIGDSIFSLIGEDTVQWVKKNKIHLERLIHLNFGSKTIITTKEHLFYTNKGWVKAESLKQHHVIHLFGHHSKEFTNGRIPLQIMWHDYKSKFSQLAKEKKKVLFQRMCKKSIQHTNEKRQKLSKKLTFKKSQKKSNSFYQKSMEEHARRNIKEIIKKTFQTFKKEQPDALRKERTENERNQKEKWNFKRLVGGTWRQWQTNRTTNQISYCFEVGNGSSYKNVSRIHPKREKEKVFKFKKLTSSLQDGCSQQEIENCNRNRWTFPQLFGKKEKGQQKNKMGFEIRLESSQAYQQGSNDQLFKSVVGDKERNTGFVEMYDLQVKKHPSYFANEIPVHNCHMLGRGGDSSKNEAQQAFLKALEDTPKHVYFILCTTNPEMLNKTIKSRCIEFKVQTLSEIEATKLIKRVCLKEKKKLDKKVVKKIAKSSEGHGRDCLQILQKVIHETDIKKQLKLAVREETEEQVQVNKLCQGLLKRDNWNNVRKILNTMKGNDPETLRRQIIGYSNAVLLNGGEDASLILGWFLYKTTYDCGFPLITQFCYNIVNEIEPPC